MPAETRSLTELTPDPRNARRHTPENVALIASALTEVGAARSIVVDEAGRVLAGNATLEAARQVGLTSVRIIDADGQTLIAVCRAGLTEAQKARLALLDNRAGELAAWDADVLSALLDAGVRADDLWTEAELAALLGPVPDAIPATSFPAESSPVPLAESSPVPLRGSTPPAEFPVYDETLPTNYRCPRCAYEWSGAAKT